MPLIPKDNSTYKDKSYWDLRFASEADYDWLAKFKDVEELLKVYIKPSDKILVVGCGNSSFSADLYKAGYENVTNIDFSEVVIRNMEILHTDKPNMKWVTADMTMLEKHFAPRSFDVVIDKAAMDALMCDEGDVWSPKPHVMADATLMCKGVALALKPEGKFLQISFSQPHFRRNYLLGESNLQSDVSTSESYGWKLKHHNINIGLGYFFYVMY